MNHISKILSIFIISTTGLLGQNVGINTTTPQADLHIIGDSIILEDAVSNETLRFSADEFWQVIKSSKKLIINPYDENGEVVIGEYYSGSNNSILSILSDSMGVMLPKLTTVQIASINIGMGDEGLLLYNTDNSGFEYYDGTSWSSLGGNISQYWIKNGSNIHYNAGSVGINTSSPEKTLHIESPDVNGGLRISRFNTSVDLDLKAAGNEASIGTNSNHALRLLTNNSVRVEIENTGEMGIGTTNPLEKLHVNGAIKLGSTSNSNPGSIRYTGSDFQGHDGSGWKSLTDKDDADADITNELQQLSINGQDLTLSNGGGTVPIPVGGNSPWNTSGSDVYYDSGNVGIGTNAPSEALEVSGDMLIQDDNQGVIINMQSQLGAGIVAEDNGYNVEGVLGWDFNTNEFIIENDDGTVLTDKDNKITLYNPTTINGDLTISDGSPSIIHDNILNIYNPQSDSTALIISPNEAQFNGESTLLLSEDDDGTYGMGLHYDGDLNMLRVIGQTSTIYNDSILNINRDNGQIAMGNDFATGYKLSVEGKIICEELQVELSTGWPDYVFEKEYDLMTLPEVKKFIDKNGHLPNIPSAKQVDKEGVSVGEMNRLLMEKVEELTLYILSLNEKNKDLEKRITQIENN